MSLLKINGLCRSFGGLRAVDGLSFGVARGEVVGLLGPNGSGKTTAMNLISGALHADAGEIVFDGHRIEKLPPHRIARLGVARAPPIIARKRKESEKSAAAPAETSGRRRRCDWDK